MSVFLSTYGIKEGLVHSQLGLYCVVCKGNNSDDGKKAGTVFVGRAVFDFACLDGRTRRNIIQIGTRGKEENGRRGGGRHTRKQEVKGEAEEGQEEKRGGGPNE